MPVIVTDIDDWDIEAEAFTGFGEFDAGGETIAPSLTRHRGVTVTGRDWLPIKDGQVALLIHSPASYFQKRHLTQCLRATSQGVVAETGPVRALPGTSLLVGGVPNHYHWLVDYLPRLLLARKVMRHLPRILLHTPTSVQRESLELLGIDDWESVEPGESVRCDDLWIPSLLARNTVAHPAVPQLLREAYPARTSAGRRNVYLSRRDASSRGLVNEQALIEAMPDFELHTAAALTFQQQVDLFASADTVLAVHGAGLANTVFCRPGTRVYEIYAPEHKVTSMYMLAKVCELEHRFVPARTVAPGADGRSLLGTWEVDIDAVRAAML